MNTAAKVSFSSRCQVHNIDYPTLGELGEKWYSRRDKQYFRRVLAHDIVMCSRMLSMKATSGESLSEHEMIQCLGLESMLSFDIALRVYLTRRNHLNQILREPAHDEVEQLAHVSQLSSQESRTRSHKIAVRMMGLNV
jgi:hypothetical protein